MWEKTGLLKFTDNKSIDSYHFSLSNAAPDRLIITEESIKWHRKTENKPYEVLLEPNFKESALKILLLNPFIGC